MRHRFVAVVLLSAAVGCGRGTAPEPTGGALHVSLHPAASRVLPAYVDVTGLSASELASLRAAHLGEAEWQSLFTVRVGGEAAGLDLPAVGGRYAVTDRALTFTPRFPFDPGRSYRITFDPTKMPRPRQAASVTEVVGLPPVATVPSTVVTAMHPSADVVPENLLRIYIEFSAPMGSHSGLDFVHLLERTGADGGTEVPVEGSFLPVDANLWSPDHTRYTLYFDPGRVKAGIFPNRQVGRPLVAGRRYVLTVDSGWTDANSLPLKAGYRYEFKAGPAVDEAIKMSDWKIKTPLAGTREPLVVTFAWPVDHAVVVRALGVETTGAASSPGATSALPIVDGDIALQAHDTRWVFTPTAPWTAGEYNLVALSFLEDPQGNRVGRAFEVFDTGSNEPTPDAFRTAFTVAPRR